MMELFGISMVALVVGLTELAKRSGFPKRWCFLLAYGLGLGLGFWYGLSQTEWTLFEIFVRSSALGLSASGVFSGLKHTFSGGQRRK